jgi:hypothetical protein
LSLTDLAPSSLSLRISATKAVEPEGTGNKQLQGEISSERPLQEEIAHENPEPVFDDTKARLQFWRDSKTFLKTLSARINQLRTITHETSERMRRHGTAELLERLQPNEKPPNTLEIVNESPETGIMAKLREKLNDVNHKLEQLQILVTGVRLGPRGPMDPQYSESWIEHHIHEDEKIEFERTAVRMGYAPNSISMDPVISEEQRTGMEELTRDWFENITRIGVGGEYRDIGITPVKGMLPYLDVAQEYVANSGMSESDKRQKLAGFERTFKKFGLDKESDEEAKDEDKVADSIEKGEPVVEETSATGDQGVQALEELPKDEIEALEPVHMEPGESISPEYVKIITEIQRSMAEIDKDVSSLEESYDAMLERQPQIPSSQASTQEKST